MSERIGHMAMRMAIKAVSVVHESTRISVEECVADKLCPACGCRMDKTKAGMVCRKSGVVFQPPSWLLS